MGRLGDGDVGLTTAMGLGKRVLVRRVGGRFGGGEPVCASMSLAAEIIVTSKGGREGTDVEMDVQIQWDRLGRRLPCHLL